MSPFLSGNFPFFCVDMSGHGRTPECTNMKKDKRVTHIHFHFTDFVCEFVYIACFVRVMCVLFEIHREVFLKRQHNHTRIYTYTHTDCPIIHILHARRHRHYLLSVDTYTPWLNLFVEERKREEERETKHFATAEETKREKERETKQRKRH